MYFKVTKDAKDEFRWTLFAGNHEKIANAGEGYKTKASCLEAIDRIKKCGDAPVKDETD